MALVRKNPGLDPEIVIGPKEVCQEIGISPTSLRRYRSYGWIKQLNEGNTARPKYSGEAVNQLWNNIVTKALHL